MSRFRTRRILALHHAISRQRDDFVEISCLKRSRSKLNPIHRCASCLEASHNPLFSRSRSRLHHRLTVAVAFAKGFVLLLAHGANVVKKHLEFASQLQEQADRALRHFCERGDLKWVSLLMWAGADPRFDRTFIG